MNQYGVKFTPILRVPYHQRADAWRRRHEALWKLQDSRGSQAMHAHARGVRKAETVERLDAARETQRKARNARRKARRQFERAIILTGW